MQAVRTISSPSSQGRPSCHAPRPGAAAAERAGDLDARRELRRARERARACGSSSASPSRPCRSPFRSQALPLSRTTTRPPPYVPSFGAAGVPAFAPGYWPTRTPEVRQLLLRARRSTTVPMFRFTYLPVFRHVPPLKAYVLPATFTVALAGPQKVLATVPPLTGRGARRRAGTATAAPTTAAPAQSRRGGVADPHNRGVSMYHDGSRRLPGPVRHAPARRPARGAVRRATRSTTTTARSSRAATCSSWPRPTRTGGRSARTRAASRASCACSTSGRSRSRTTTGTACTSRRERARQPARRPAVHRLRAALRLRLNGDRDASSTTIRCSPSTRRRSSSWRVRATEVFPNCPRYIHQLPARRALALRAEGGVQDAGPGLEDARVGERRAAGRRPGARPRAPRSPSADAAVSRA